MPHEGRAAACVDRHRWWEAIKTAGPWMKPAMRLAAMMLSTYANKDGSSVRPGIQRLASNCGVSTRHVQRSLDGLEDFDYLVCVRRANGKAKRANEYRLSVPVNVHMALWGAPQPEQIQATLPRRYAATYYTTPASHGAPDARVIYLPRPHDAGVGNHMTPAPNPHDTRVAPPLQSPHQPTIAMSSTSGAQARLDDNWEPSKSTIEEPLDA